MGGTVFSVMCAGIPPPTPPSCSLACEDCQLDMILSEISEVKQLVNRVATLESKVAEQDATIQHLCDQVCSLTAEIKTLKEKVNTNDQLQKGNALRLFGFPGSNDETSLSTKIYDRVLKPILVAAKSKGDLSSVPQVNNVIETCFRVGKFSPGANKPPPPILIKFTSSAVRLALLKNKRTNMPSPTEGEKNNGCRRFILAEDLTTPTYRKMQELQKDDRVSKAWSINGEIWYLPTGENQKSKKVKSVYDDIDTILS